MTVEKRRYPRIGPVLVRSDCRLGEREWESYVTSLSEGGAYLVTDESLDDGDVISLSFTLPLQLGTVESDARVVYSITATDPKPDGYPTGVGLEFVAPDATTIQKLRDYVGRFRNIAARLVASD